MKRWSGLLAAFVVVLSSAPAFACHRHLFFWHGCHEGGVPVAVVPVPMPAFIPIPVPIPAPVMMAEVEVAPPMVAVEPQVAYAQPLPPFVPDPGAPVAVAVPAPAPVVVVAAPPPPMVAAPVVIAAPVVVREPEPAFRRLAAKWAPGLSAPFSWEDKAFGPTSFTNNIGAEFRINAYFALRGDLELRSGARNWEIPGIKASLFPSSRLHPFGSLSLSLNQADGQGNKFAIGYMAAVGLDLTLFRWLFVTAEARYNAVPGNCCALPRVTGLVGVGVQFF